MRIELHIPGDGDSLTISCAGPAWRHLPTTQLLAEIGRLLADALTATDEPIPFQLVDPGEPEPRSCRVCGCTDQDASVCIAATGETCWWVEPDLCSRCRIEAHAYAHIDELQPAEPEPEAPADDLEAARQEALRLLDEEGLDRAHVAAQLGVSLAQVRRWDEENAA